MGDLMKLGKWWAITAMGSRWLIAGSIAVSALAFAFGDGGAFSISWMPGGE